MANVQSFTPIVGDKPELLILGSMPGVESLSKQQYYAHSRNAFWAIISHHCQRPVPEDYQMRLQMIKDHNMALWDVFQSCYRKGSLDSAIVSEVPNDIPGFLDQYPSIRRIGCNGRRAYDAYVKNFKTLPPTVSLLPSTSPAHASMNFETKYHYWHDFLNLD